MADFKEIQIGADGQVYQVKDETARNNAGGYTPPDGGIPKADLAPAVQTSLGLADTALQAADKTQLQSAINAVQTALNNLMNGASVTDAIDTFNEVVDFLNGIDTDDPTLYNQLQTLSGAISDLQTTLAGKANASDVYTKTQTDTLLAGKQNTLAFDNEPTAGSNNPVKSGGIKTALDAKANATDVYDKDHSYSKTEVNNAIDDAFSEAQVAVVEEGTFGIIDGLGSDSTTDALSANQGKVLKAAILTLWAYLGEYAFLEGKPTLSLGTGSVEFSVTYPTDPKITATPVSGEAPETVELLGAFEVTLGIASGNDLYVIDDDSVKVYMGGVEISAYNPSTGKVTIANVVGDVVISASAITYQLTNLAFHLDCMNGVTKSGSTPTKWTDLIGNKEFVLTNVTEAQGGGMHFNGLSSGGSTAVYSGGVLAVAHDAGTIEFVIEPQNELKQFTSILFNGYDGGICALCQNITAIKGIMTAFTTNGSTNDKLGYLTTVLPAAVSLNIDNAGTRACLVNGAAAAATVGSSYYYSPGAHNTGMMAVGCYVNASDGVAFERSDQPITIKAIRVYSQKLTLQQAQKNYAIDKKRFNLA